jgi:chromosome segregation ATPase
VEQVQSQLKNEIAHLKNDLAELSKACASVSSKVAEQADQGAARLSQELKQAAESMVRTAGEDAISGYKQQLESEFNQQHKELQNAAASVREEMSQLGSRFAELNMRMEEVQRARDSVHSLIGSLSQASTQHLQESAAAAADTIRVQLEQELGRVRQQVDRESAKFEELARQHQQASLEALEHHVAGLHATSETMLQKSTAEMNASLNQRIEKDLDAQRQEWEQQRQKMREESKAHAGQLSTELESKVQETMARAASDSLNEMQVQLERAADDVLQKKVAEAEAKLQMAFDSLVIDGERTRKGIEKLVESARVENRQVEAQRTALRAQLNDADTWVAEQTEQFRKSLHDVLLEATGEIKGRIHMAVEMSKEPIEKRSRHAQAQLEELAARKTRELTQQITELEKAAGPMLQARLNQALGEFQNNADQLAKASVDRYEDELVQTLDSMLHVLRSKRSVQSGPTSR